MEFNDIGTGSLHSPWPKVAVVGAGAVGCYFGGMLGALPAVVYVAAAMAGPGHVKHSGRGDLILGIPPVNAARDHESKADLQRLAQRFERAEIPCHISTDIRVELWTKMVMNCAYNSISALGRARYGNMAHLPQIRNVMREAITETVAIAKAEGVSLSEHAMVEAAFRLGDAMFDARSSTAQDLERGKATEIESLNGYIAKRGDELGIGTPINRTLYALVKLLEQSAAK